MRDALTAFSICDTGEDSSLSIRTTAPYGNSARSQSHIHTPRPAVREGSPSSTAADFISIDNLLDDTQSSVAFIELDRRRADTTEAESLLESLRTQTAIRNANNIADRIGNLIELYKEDYDGRALSASSILTFLDFLNTHRNSKFPAITATPNGELYAQWKRDNDQRLGVQFLVGSEIKWVLLKRNPEHDEHIDYFAGQTVADSFGETATALGIREWIEE
ncbi:hypothetical protein [Pseudomonas aeruginosa]|uniref:hypothetical protein n=1 Tax=Pseudomonas aeruginosa TaxID=287 RepID=UPI000FC438FA|nr:hypothetical protein [Pseudomonas aeruginosa]RUB33865.1 hypothetical protein IPC1432_14505 [Pseudomonas aeruginosa]HCD6632435.1 hypothetical protein [Pseudomonas aeruginosa]HDQ4733794.1 hypothetical protein [Pseudomonas aeruginosa]